jgi:hypothetical protein
MLLTNTLLVHDGMHGEDCAHLSVTEVELCQEYQNAEWQMQVEAELAAEAAVERHYEDAGYWAAREQEDMEARRGVIQFEDAYAHALGYADAGDRERAEGVDLADLLDQQWDMAADRAADRQQEREADPIDLQDEAYGRF